MITKNKHSPATLYLLNAKNMNKLQEERKSARLSFNKKKSSRSISQYQKWNPTKQSTNVPFQPVTRTNSQIKRIVLSKNQFGLQNLPLQKKLSSIVQIFGNKRRIPTQPTQSQITKHKSKQDKSIQISLLSLKDDQKHQINRRKSHVRTQSMLNHSQSQNSIENTLLKVDKKFKEYQKHSQNWKLSYLLGQNDYLLDDMIKGFKSIFNQIVVQFRNVVIGNVQYFQNAIMTVMKEYQMEISDLKSQIRKVENVKNIMGNLVHLLNQKDKKNIISSMIWEDIQKKGTDLQQFIRNSPLYQKILKIHQNKTLFDPEVLSLSPINKPVKVELNCNSQSDDQKYIEEHQDYVQDNWNDQFQNKDCIKGVLKYIHNHNSKITQKNAKQEMNRTGFIHEDKRNDMKIDNWKSFEGGQKSIGHLKKILSQR